MAVEIVFTWPDGRTEEIFSEEKPSVGTLVKYFDKCWFVEQIVAPRHEYTSDRFLCVPAAAPGFGPAVGS